MPVRSTLPVIDAQCGCPERGGAGVNPRLHLRAKGRLPGREVLRAVVALTEFAATGAHAAGHAAALLEDLHVQARIGKHPGAGQSGNAGTDDGNTRVWGEGMGHGGLLALAAILTQLQARLASVLYRAHARALRFCCQRR
jgi:hypothetical protein